MEALCLEETCYMSASLKLSCLSGLAPFLYGVLCDLSENVLVTKMNTAPFYATVHWLFTKPGPADTV